MCFDKLPDHAELPLGSIIPALNEHARDLTGGSTASIVRVSPTGLVEVERVGDSSVRLYNLAAPSDGIELPEDDHSATSVAEYRRVSEKFGAAGGGFCWFKQGVGLIPPSIRPVFTKTDAGEWQLNPAGGFQHCDVHKNWASYFVTSYDRPLAMTRAVGDNEFRPFGLISEPAVATHQLEAGTRSAIILASDGLWDIFPLADAYTIVGRSDLFGNADAAADELLRLGMERGHAAWGPVIDNITVTVIFIDMPSAPKPESESKPEPESEPEPQPQPEPEPEPTPEPEPVHKETPVVTSKHMKSNTPADTSKCVKKGKTLVRKAIERKRKQRELKDKAEKAKRSIRVRKQRERKDNAKRDTRVRKQERIAKKLHCANESNPALENVPEVEVEHNGIAAATELMHMQFRNVLNELRERAIAKEAAQIRNQFRNVLDELLWRTGADDIDEYYDWDPYSREYSDYANYPDYDDDEHEASEDQSEISEEELRQMYKDMDRE
jgi:hypothetical protein